MWKKVSKSFVSNLTKELDEIVNEWQYRDILEGEYPYIIVDVIYIKVRENRQVVSKSCHITIGISKEGNREILGFLIQEGESQSTWTKFFDYLNKRGLKGVNLVISDAHKGLVKSIREQFTGSSWQRCQVHFLRNIFESIPKKDSQNFREKIKSIFRLSSIEEARKVKDQVLEEYEDNKQYTRACKTLDEGFEDAFEYTLTGKVHSRLKSMNLLERLNEEIRRREKVIRIFPNTESANRLIGAILIDKHEEWITSPKKYIKI